MAESILRSTWQRLGAVRTRWQPYASVPTTGPMRVDPETCVLRRLGALVVMILVPALVLIGLCQWMAVQRLDEIAASERDVVRAQVAAAQNALGRVSTDVCTLARANELRAFLATRDAAQLPLMAEEYAVVATEARNYDQIRFIDNVGMEMVRVQLEQNRPVIVEHAALQNKLRSHYVRDALRARQGSLYVSPLDLNVERGMIEMPPKPMLRLATPVADESGAAAGIIVINVLADTILDAVREAGAGDLSQPSMLNSDGYWLLDGGGNRSWGFMFPDAVDSRLAAVDPAAWAAMRANTSGSARTATGLYTFAWFTFAQARQRCGGQDALSAAVDRSWVMVSHVPQQKLVAAWRRAAGFTAFTGLPLLLIGVIVTRAINDGRIRRHQYRANLERLARSDKLTGLANRAAFEEHLKTAVKEGERTGLRFALLLVDLDHFKEVNDSLGHDAGDALLRAVAARLSGCVRNGDVVARMGGDEFAAILIGDAHRDGLEKVAGRMLRAIQAPFTYADREIQPGGSIGVACFPADGSGTAELFKSADLALYRAKRNGRRSFHFFDHGMREEASARLDLATDIRTSLDAGDFHVVFQPVMRLADGSLRGFEALVRWQHPHRGTIAPSAFLPIAEDNGLLGKLGDVVLDLAAETIATFWSAEDADCVVALNAGAAQLKDPAFGANVLARLRAHGVAPQRLQIDVGEDVIVSGNQQICATLQALRAAGVSVALDDFGTGYASLTHLKQLPLDVLKVDRSFVAGVVDDTDTAAIVRAVIDLAHGLHMQVVAEGIETQAQLDTLARLGCDYGQGYLIARPAPAEALGHWRQGRPIEEAPAL